MYKVPYYNWSNPETFQLSPSPIIKGSGELSDSLLAIFDVESVYECNEEYYLINSWADYYEWYTTKYWFQFELPELYQYYYNIDDEYGMVNFIANNFKGSYYPSKIAITTQDNDQILAHWSTKKILGNNKEKVFKYTKRLQKQHLRESNLKIKSEPITYGTEKRSTTIANNQNYRRNTASFDQSRTLTKSTTSARTRTVASGNRRSTSGTASQRNVSTTTTGRNVKTLKQ